MISSSISQIFNSAQEIPQPIRVYGATQAAQAFLILRLVQERKSPLLVLCPDDDLASELATDIETISQAIGHISAMNIKVHHFPTWERSPYSLVAPSIRTRFARIATLSALHEKQNNPLIISTLLGITQATLPHALFQNHSLTIREGDIFDSRAVLLKKLNESGYFLADPVEDPGTYTLRGEIIDIFPLNRTYPIRIEFFDQMVEKIREFDPATQRTLSSPINETLKTVFLPPAREVLINSSTASLVREKIKQFSDDKGISRSVRDPILSTIQDGIYPENCDSWAPFAYEKPATLLDYLDQATILWIDEAGCLESWDRLREENLTLYQQIENRKNISWIMPEFNELFRWDQKNETKTRTLSKFFLDRILLADLTTVEQSESEDQDEFKQPAPSPNHKVFVRSNHDLKNKMESLEPKIELWNKKGFQIYIFASTQSQLDRIQFLFNQRGLLSHKSIKFIQGDLSSGLRWPAEQIVFLTEDEILGSKHTKKIRRSSSLESGSASKDWSGLQALSDLSVGDAVVHVDHGIGKYLGIARLDLSGAPSDFLFLEYANKDKLYVPIYRLNVVQKYIGSADLVTLDKLGGQHFAKAKEKVQEAVKKLAVNLVELYALRQTQTAYRFSPRDTIFREFESKFPFQETPDQLKAIDDILKDMESGIATDRLVCGDVGYGKTEVAMRAAYRAILDGKQVTVLVPTTVLALQHEQSFKARFEGIAVRIESISRFKSPKELKATLEGLAQGRVDIVIGTHRLLSRDVQFKDLGLVIVDEEHRFGVDHKEKLKTLKTNVHVLTLTATPIPRTLHMSLSGLRDISLIHTPPVDRLPIRTYVAKYDEALIQRAIETELKRGGQVFFVHNRVQTIYEIAKQIQELVPTAKVGVGHGQMSEKELEDVMVSFYKKDIQILVSTTIIESGLDVPSANTIIIHRADTLGLAQLYQIRGRVGRSQQRAYAYLLIPAEKEITEDAKKRLEILQKFVELGSGFSIASHDLEIRGGGDLLGPQQSGHIAAVGFDLYTELLEEAIHELRNKGQSAQEKQTLREPEIKIPFPAFLSEKFIPDVHQRLSIYRRFSATTQESETLLLEEELKDRFGALPEEAQNFIWLIRIKQLLKKYQIEALTVGTEKFTLVFGAHRLVETEKIIQLISSHPHQYQLTPDSKLVVKAPCSSLKDVNFTLEALFEKIRAA